MSVGYATSKDSLTRNTGLTQQGPMYGINSTVPNWVRPSDWLPLPEVGYEENKVVGLVSVADADGQFLALWAYASPGNFVVDWGDGTIETFASGTTVRNHEYNYSTISSPLLSDGSKQVIVQIYPENPATSILTQVNLNVKYTGATPGSLTSFFSYGWLDILVNAPNLTNLVVGNGSAGVSFLMKCRQFELRRCGVLGMTNTFTLGGLVSLESVPAMNYGGFANMQNLFYNCYKLRVCPPIPWQFCTNAFQMFFGCASLVYVPDATTPMHSNFTAPNSVTRGMFQGCISLTRAPWLDTSKNINTQSMFNGCTSLQYVPNYDYSNCANTLTMFTGCSSLENLPEFLNFGNVPVLNTGTMFGNCYSLTSAPDIDISGSTSMSFMFQNCQSLVEIPPYNTSNVTTMASTFSGCTSLNSLPVLDTSKVTNFSNSVPGTALPIIPAYDLSNCTTLGSIISSGSFSANNISRIDAYGMKVSYSVVSQHLSTAALETMFRNTQGNATSQTCTITGNFGADTPISKTTTTAYSSGLQLNLNSTTGLVVGMKPVSGNLISGTTSVSGFSSTNDISLSAGFYIQPGSMAAFTTVTGTDFVANKIYYVKTFASNRMTLSNTLGGPAITVTANFTGSLRWDNEITSIVDATTVYLKNSSPSLVASAGTINFRLLNTYLLTLKNWTISG